ncbi:MAG TPA: FtsX-like permease family protein [Bryobacteraceae bacterium]|nr:FtsX-like permease family protein [Bryobacteraceae bacterium]
MPVLLKIAWRDGRASVMKFLFVVLAVAVGVGSLAGVRGFSRAFHRMLLTEARTLMAADISARTFALPTPDQIAVMQDLGRHGVRRTWITETLSMASAGEGTTPLLVSVKAVDPRVYPFYGTIRLNPPGQLRDELTSETVAVSDDLLLRLKLHVGDTIRLGGQSFRIAASIAAEPDRMAGSMNVGPRVMMTREGLERTGLIRFGSRAAERFLFRLPADGMGIAEARGALKKAFPEAFIVDYRQTHPIITEGLNRATTFLSLVSLITLIVGALGVATTMHAHLQQRLDSIAVMKCLGARSSQILQIYVAQTLALGLVGGVIGVAFGFALQSAFPIFLARYFQIEPGLQWDAFPALEGLGIGMLTTLLFTVPPLLGIRTVRPSLIFRRDMLETTRGRSERWAEARPSLLAGVAILLGIGGIAASLVSGGWKDALKTGGYFVAGLLFGIAALALIAWLLLRGLKAISRRAPRTLPSTIRHGVANLYRPGNHAQSVLVALGIGVMFTLTVYLIQHGLLEQMQRTAPPGMPNVFLLDIAANHHDAVLDLLRKQHGVVGSPEMMGTVAAKLSTIDGVALESMALKRYGRRYQRARAVTSAGASPNYIDVLDGAWWHGKPAETEVSVSEEAAHTLGLKPGARTEWTIGPRTFPARVASVYRVDSVHLVGRVDFIFNAGALDGFPITYYASLRAQPSAVAGIETAMYDRFPTVTVVNVADVLEIVQQVVDQIARVVQFISAFAILAGAIILASSVAGTRFRRIREVVILKTLGATRRRVSSIFSVEFLILGTVAGVMGSLLASAFSALLLKRLLHAEVQLAWLPNLVAILLTALIANAAGWLASYRILGQKPLEVLRGE